MRRPVLVDQETVHMELGKSLAIDFSGTPWPEMERRLALLSEKQAKSFARGERFRQRLQWAASFLCGCAVGLAIVKAVMAWLT